MVFMKSIVKKWFAMLPALNISFPVASFRFSAVAREISLYSTVWYFPSSRQITPTGSVGTVFSTTFTSRYLFINTV